MDWSRSWKWKNMDTLRLTRPRPVLVHQTLNTEIVQILSFYSEMWMVLKLNASYSRSVIDAFGSFIHSLIKLRSFLFNNSKIFS